MMDEHNRFLVFRDSLGRHLMAVATISAMVAAAAGILDAADIALRLGPRLEALAVLGLCGGALGGIATVVFLAVTTLYFLAGLLGHKVLPQRHGFRRWLQATATVALVCPFLVIVGGKLFQGGMMSRFPASRLLAALTAIALPLLAVLVARVVLRVLSWSDAASERRRRALVALGAVLLALGFHLLDALCYRRLYLYLHDGLCIAALASLAIAARALRPPLPTFRRPLLAGLAAAMGLVALSALCLALLGARPSLKALSVEHTASFAAVLRHFPSPAKRPMARGAAAPYRAGDRQSSASSSSSALPTSPGASVLLITVDALRADRLGIYGHKRRDLTGQLDEWARQHAIVFDRAYTPVPHSSYSISSMHTSRFLYQESALSLPVVHPTLAETLKEAGYRTEAFYTQGIFFSDGDRVGYYRTNKFGFEETHSGAPDAAPLTEHAIAAVDRMVTSNRPTFLWVHYFNVHEPYLSTALGTSAADRYDGEVAEVDAAARRLIDYAKQRLGERLITVLSADHGEEFKDHGGDYHGSSLYDEQVRVPLLIAAPGYEPRRVQGAVSTVSISSTILGLLGISPPLSMVGQDLRPAMLSGKAPESFVFCAVHRKQGVVRMPYTLIVEPTLGTMELYDLEQDPAERVNLSDTHGETATQFESALWGFVDELGQARTWEQAALNLGKMREPRAVPDLLRIAIEEEREVAERVAALELLCGLVGQDAMPQLAGLLKSDDHRIATGAALVLSSTKDPRGTNILQDALLDPDPMVRDKASLALATLGDRTAVPTLIDTLGRGDMDMRQDAIRALGELRDKEAEEPLIDLLVDIKSKYLIVLALGKIAGPRTFDTLKRVLETDPYADVRGYAVVALGWLEDPRGVPLLRKVLREEPDIKWTVEALIRLRALGSFGFYGVDARSFEKGLASGFGKCTVRPKIIASEFLGATTCETKGQRAEVQLLSDIEGPAKILISARHLIPSVQTPIELVVSVDDKTIGTVELTALLRSQGVSVPFGALRKGQHRVILQLAVEGAFELDHLVAISLDSSD
ncbi:MAG: sulfatase-like hydrolase/transferase [Myxococcota bacterium]|nr:sulfatase-like hydrolase/transferase [Myxococcota bacterium]